MKHATVRLGDYQVPLIGVDRSATEDECDLCGDKFHISCLTFTGRQFLCSKCNKDNWLVSKQATDYMKTV